MDSDAESRTSVVENADLMADARIGVVGGFWGWIWSGDMVGLVRPMTSVEILICVGCCGLGSLEDFVPSFFFFLLNKYALLISFHVQPTPGRKSRLRLYIFTARDRSPSDE